MAVLAHPDDESLGAGGVLARYAAEGVGVHLVTATRGQRGRYKGVPPGDGHPGPEAMARIREGELRAAAAALGVREVVILDYMDGALDQADPGEATSLIATHLRRVRPQVVLTFDPYGAYGHPDHIAICQFTTAALIAAADPAGARVDRSLAPHTVSKLYYMVSTESSWAAYQAAFKRLVSQVDGVERVGQPWPDWAITTQVDTREYWPTVWRAVSCHETQIGAYEKLRDLSPEYHERLWGSQRFYRALSLVNGGRRLETDLFEGLR
jgi:LmbE family N-acetylglucosaminyl deacetylase